jgi:pyrroloquinoline quinone biosynthesis protein B
VAISGDGASWYLLNASPDLRSQLLAWEDLAPEPGTRDTPLRGVLLSTAELDHTLGLLSLREARHLDVYSSGTVLAALTTAFPVTPILGSYADIAWHDVTAHATVELAGGLHVRRFTIGAKAPRYAAAVAGAEWVSAWEIRDLATDGRLVYATCFGQWGDELAALVAQATCAILDGTFLTDDEMVLMTGAGPLATTMGHMPVNASVALARRTGLRVLYSHLNNTNPLARPDGGGDDLRAAHGVEVAEDGQELVL